MNKSIFYLGDTALDNAAAYLAGVMQHAECLFDYLPSDQRVSVEMLKEARSLYILSDYPSANFTADCQQRLLEHVQSGSGLIMFGGWESFHGLGGDWDGSPIAQALPVEIANSDDRVNCDHPVLLWKKCEHEILANLPWDERPPVIGGFNRVTAKPAATVLLEAKHISVRREGEAFRFETAESDPLLVVGSYGKGRVTTLMTDVAPHWVGPLVDWGDGRVNAQATGAEEIEVGDWYAQFFRQLIDWTRVKSD